MRYMVKFQDKKGNWVYGIYRDPKWEKPPLPVGQCIVEDAILPKAYQVPEEVLVDIKNGEFIPCTFGVDDFGPLFDDEYHRYVAEQYKKAVELSDSVEGFAVGKMLTVGVADGCAYYVITKVNKKTVRVEWRGFSGDRHIAPLLGRGGTFPMHMLEPYVRRADYYTKSSRERRKKGAK